MNTTNLAVKLTTEIRLVDKQIVVKYRLTNEMRADICVFNKLYRTQVDGERILDDRMAYVLFEKGETIHLTRSLVPIPEGLKVEYPEVPYVTILGAGKTLEEQVVIAVPVREVHPYREPVAEETAKERTFEHVCFSLGVMPTGPGLELRKLPKAGEGVFAVSYADAIQRQTLVRSAPIRLQVTGRVAK